MTGNTCSSAVQVCSRSYNEHILASEAGTLSAREKSAYNDLQLRLIRILLRRSFFNALNTTPVCSQKSIGYDVLDNKTILRAPYTFR